ncbi:MAG: PAS domain S-box protein [Gemmataceae bacterium]|nr:PAS domain S-box protein [Gemmataceae bacterium]
MLATSDARLRALLEAAVDGIISIDARGVIQTFNPAAERLFGYAAREVIGQNVNGLMPSPYQEEHDRYLARYVATGEKKIIGIGREVVGRRKDGTTFPMDLSVAEARLADEQIFVGIIRDISERKRAEESLSQLAAIVESSDDAIISTALDGTIVTWNAGAERCFGYSLGEVKGQHISMLAPADLSCDFAAMLERIKRGERIDHYETVRIRKDGRPIDVSVTISPIKDAAGKVLGVSAIKRDISEQRKINDEVRAMTQQLWQAAKLASVGELAASIAHELNNPLATVSLRIESVLGRTPADDPRRRALEVIEQETKRMGELVASLLQFSRRGEEKISTVDLRQELGKAVELIHHHLRKRLVTVVQELAPDTPTIYADRQKLRQVFLNLLTNAGDAMPRGGTVTLRTARAALEGGEPAVRIDFSDTGVGIPAEHLEKVMDPFFTTKEEGKGTGLGLAICRRIVQEHQGTIQISSEVSKGTTVCVVLPVRSGANVKSIRGSGAVE